MELTLAVPGRVWLEAADRLLCRKADAHYLVVN
jgi:hypothetical protein